MLRSAIDSVLAMARNARFEYAAHRLAEVCHVGSPGPEDKLYEHASAGMGTSPAWIVLMSGRVGYVNPKSPRTGAPVIMQVAPTMEAALLYEHGYSALIEGHASLAAYDRAHAHEVRT